MRIKAQRKTFKLANIQPHLSQDMELYHKTVNLTKEN